MYLSYLDKKIPDRWVLLLRYYLPFFKTPPSFYFILRKFINKKKRDGDNFSIVTLDTLIEILKILEESSEDNNNLGYLKEIIEGIPPEQLAEINAEFLEKLFTIFDPKNKNSLLLELLDRLSLTIFPKYLVILQNHLICSKNTNAYYLHQLNWCEKLTNKFGINDKLRLLLSMPDPLVANYIINIEKLINTSSIFTSSFLEKVNLDIKESFLQFCMKWKTHLNIKDEDFFRLFTTLFSLNSEKGTSFLKNDIPRLSEKERLDFLKDSLQEEALFEIIFNTYPEEKRSLLIDLLIVDYFNHPNNNANPLLHFLKQESLEKYSLHLFQILAIVTLTKQPFDMEMITKIYTAHSFLDTGLEAFTSKIQVTVINAMILSIQDHISESVILEIPRKYERCSLHRLWRQFKGVEPLVDPHVNRVQLLGKIVEKMVMEVPEDKKENAIISFNLLMELCRLLEENPELKELNDREKMQAEKWLAEEEAREVEKAKTRKLIAQGVPISPERMKEVFGKDEGGIKVPFPQKGQGSFFYGKDKEECNNDQRQFLRNYFAL